MGRGGMARRRLALALVATSSLALGACSAGSLGSSSGTTGGGDPAAKVEISYLTDSSEDSATAVAQLIKDFNAVDPDITVKVETRPEGSDGDNVIKTRLATGDMSDVFEYNSGSLFQALDPAHQLAPVTGEKWIGNLAPSFKSAVSVGTDVYGAPTGSSNGGGILYSRPVYQKLGLQVPTTWAEFMANNATIKAAGLDPVLQSYQDSWTSQIMVLADYHNVAAADPTFAADYTANKAKYATTPAAEESFQKLQDVHDAGYLNPDFASAKIEDVVRELAQGKGAHYPILTSRVASMVTDNPNAAQDVGFFALPGDDAAKVGATVWLPGAVYIPKTTTGPKLDAAKKLLAFIASPQGCASQAKVSDPTGPYVVTGCTLPDTVPQAIKDLTQYFDKGNVTPALEFLSPVKGPSLEQILVEVGSGIRKAPDAAALYDDDVKKQAQQLGLAGW